MLPLQVYLINGGNPEDLALRVYYHPTLPLVGYKYENDSPKTHPVVINARGTVLDLDHNLVARSFNRFFNFGETDQSNFYWNGATHLEKVDGSLIIVYHYNGELCINTSGSFGYGLAHDSDKSFRQLFLETCEYRHINLKKELDPKFTYIFELCTLDNKVVKDYYSPTVYLLSIFDGWKELPYKEVSLISLSNRWDSPKRFSFDYPADIQDWIKKNSVNNPKDEGIVSRDVENNRIKLKSDTYCLLAHAKSNGKFNVQTLVRLILSGEKDEVLVHFPELSHKFSPVEQQLNEIVTKVEGIYSQVQAIENQKEFALAVKGHKFSGLLFNMRSKGFSPREILLSNLAYAEKLLS